MATTCSEIRTISQAEVANILSNRASGAPYPRHTLFHLLIADFVSNWWLTDQRVRLGRMFEHRKMSGAVLKLQDKKNPTAVEAELQKTISAFAQLQEERYKAGYNVEWIWESG